MVEGARTGSQLYKSENFIYCVKRRNSNYIRVACSLRGKNYCKATAIVLNEQLKLEVAHNHSTEEYFYQIRYLKNKN